MTKDNAQKLLDAFERWVDAKISDAQRDPGESRCGGTFNASRYKNEIVELLTTDEGED